MKISRMDNSRAKITKWLQSEIPHWNIVGSYALSHLCISNNTILLKSDINVLYTTSMMYTVLTIIAEGVGKGHTEISHFWGMKICVSGALARFARSRVLVNKWVKAFYSIEYNQSNINNGSDRPSSSLYRNITLLTLEDFMKIYSS